MLALGNVRTGNNSDLFIVVFGMSVCFWVVITNQLHKFAHMLQPPAWVAALQRWHVVLDRKSHNMHHHTPFDRYYCITNGWLNPVLGSIAFWKRMELTITKYTGVQPRYDDAFWTVQTPEAVAAMVGSE